MKYSNKKLLQMLHIAMVHDHLITYSQKDAEYVELLKDNVCVEDVIEHEKYMEYVLIEKSARRKTKHLNLVPALTQYANKTETIMTSIEYIHGTNFVHDRAGDSFTLYVIRDWIEKMERQSFDMDVKEVSFFDCKVYSNFDILFSPLELLKWAFEQKLTLSFAIPLTIEQKLYFQAWMYTNYGKVVAVVSSNVLRDVSVFHVEEIEYIGTEVAVRESISFQARYQPWHEELDVEGFLKNINFFQRKPNDITVRPIAWSKW